MFYYKNCMKPITKSVINSVTYGWNYSQNKYFFSLLGPPGTPSRKRIPRLWVSGPYFESLLTYSLVCFWLLFKTCKCIHTYCICCASSIQRILYKRKLMSINPFERLFFFPCPKSIDKESNR